MKFFFLLLLPFIFSCQGSTTKANGKPTDSLPVKSTAPDNIPEKELAGNFSSQTAFRFDSRAIPSFLTQYPLFKKYKDDFNRFYSSRQNAYAWHQPDGRPIEQSSIIYNLVFNIDENGLPSDIPYPDEYTKLMEDESPDFMTDRELMITGQYLVYARKVLTGIPESGARALN